eukprot:m.111877 g.111877  ORF g.111877 m.111877 type:complete len:354 (+) comp14361_c2_seq6:2105-3166(+)
MIAESVGGRLYYVEPVEHDAGWTVRVEAATGCWAAEIDSGYPCPVGTPLSEILKGNAGYRLTLREDARDLQMRWESPTKTNFVAATCWRQQRVPNMGDLLGRVMNLAALVQTHVTELQSMCAEKEIECAARYEKLNEFVTEKTEQELELYSLFTALRESKDKRYVKLQLEASTARESAPASASTPGPATTAASAPASPRHAHKAVTISPIRPSHGAAPQAVSSPKVASRATLAAQDLPALSRIASAQSAATDASDAPSEDKNRLPGIPLDDSLESPAPAAINRAQRRRRIVEEPSPSPGLERKLSGPHPTRPPGNVAHSLSSETPTSKRPRRQDGLPRPTPVLMEVDDLLADM